MITPRISSVKTFAVALFLVAIAILALQHHTAAKVNGEQGRGDQTTVHAMQAVGPDGTVVTSYVNDATGQVKQGIVQDAEGHVIASWDGSKGTNVVQYVEDSGDTVTNWVDKATGVIEQGARQDAEGNVVQRWWGNGAPILTQG